MFNKEEEEDAPFPTYEQYLRETGVISLNIGDANCTFGGDYVSEFGIGCVQVANEATPTMTKGVLALSREIVLITWWMVTLMEVPEERWYQQMRSQPG